MSLNMFSSWMEDSLKKLAQCARRNVLKEPTGCVIPREVFLQYAPVRHSNSPKDVAKATKVPDIAEVSTTDFSSDGLEQPTGSTDGSDTDSNMIKMMSALNLAATNQRQKPERRVPVKAGSNKAPPGLAAPPPGLDEAIPARPTQKAAPPGQDGPRQKLNSKASAFVPTFGAAVPTMDAEQGKSQQLRTSIRMLKEVLEEWETGFEDQRPQNDMSGLQDALSRLNPQEVAMVTAFLDSQQDPHSQQPGVYPGAMQAAAYPYGQPVQGYTPSGMSLGWGVPQWNGEGAQQSFAPFKGPQRFNTPIGAKQQPKQRKPAGKVVDENAESLSTHLRDLAQLDSGRVLMVRKINHLSGDPIATLKTYFAKFGTVERIMASPTRSGGKPGRIRPATLGFMVMATVEEVQAVLADGPEHVVDGVTVLTSTFQSHAIDEKPAQ